MINYGPHNKVQINYSVDRGSDGSVVRTALVVTIREHSIESAVALYQELQKQLGGGEVVALIKDESGNAHLHNGKEVTVVPSCPKHNIKMLLRSRKSDGATFYGCQFFQNGCKETIPT